MMNKNNFLPYMIDVYPNKSQYLSGEDISIHVQMMNPNENQIQAVITINVMLLHDVIVQRRLEVILQPQSEESIDISLSAFQDDWQGYGVDVTLQVENQDIQTFSTAFDVVSTWKKAPRYGFLSDFHREDEQDSKDIEQMVKYHLNVVQFYDWMYRHDNLIPEENYFIDPLSRELSLKAIKNKIKLCHTYGMRALAYGAVYAASKEFYEKHKEWALYDNSGKVQNLGDGWLAIMNISPKSPWFHHIINEFKKTVELLDFDGIQMDTYGFPKTAYSMQDGQKKLEKLNEHFPALINTTKKQLEAVKEDIGLIFNAVSSWSIETVAPAEQDAVYIEVWDPCDRYFHLYHLINRGRELGKKPVILAAYISAYLKENNIKPEYAENCLLLASAVIFASGGYHILLGENNGVLAHPYFVRYGVIRQEFERMLRNYYDFIVRYANLLYDPGLADVSMTHVNGINDDYRFSNGRFSSYGEADKIWTIIKEKPGYKIIHLINFTGIQSEIWNEPKEKRPATANNIVIKALIDEHIKGIFLCSPDINNGVPQELTYEFEPYCRGRVTVFNVPELKIWDLIYIEVE